jgi:hypothetical protein
LLTECVTGDIIIARVRPAQPLMSRSADFALRTERLGPLPLVNHFIECIGLEALLEQHVLTTDRRSDPANVRPPNTSCDCSASPSGTP